MAKSIYEILNDLTTTTSVPDHGSEIPHTIPRELLPTAEQFESEDNLLAWARDNDVIHSCLQKGIQKFLIEIRAAFKSCKKSDTWTEDYGQKNVDAMEWNITKRPNQGGAKKLDEARFADCMAMIVTLTGNGMDSATIKTMTEPIYGKEIVNSIFDAIAKPE